MEGSTRVGETAMYLMLEELTIGWERLFNAQCIFHVRRVTQGGRRYSI